MAIQHDFESGQFGVDTLLPGFTQVYEDATSQGQQELQKSLGDYLRIAEFGVEIDTPFCVENNVAYAAPHAVLHEMAHWRVKPDSYIQVYRELSHRDYSIHMGELVVAKGFGLGEKSIPNLKYYHGTNDRMPDWDLPDGLDPTPNEKAVRAWTRHAIDHLDLQDPILTGQSQPYSPRGVGDSVVAKGSSFRTWAESAINHPRAIAEFSAFGIAPEQGIYKPLESSLILPHPTPKSLHALRENVEAMGEQHPSLTYTYPRQMEDWESHMAWKFPNMIK
jgi:hypothetical protein